MTEVHDRPLNNPAPAEIPPELDVLRRSIDNIDAALVHLLAERFKATQAVGLLKAQRQEMGPRG